MTYDPSLLVQTYTHTQIASWNRRASYKSTWYYQHVSWTFVRLFDLSAITKHVNCENFPSRCWQGLLSKKQLLLTYHAHSRPTSWFNSGLFTYGDHWRHCYRGMAELCVKTSNQRSNEWRQSKSRSYSTGSLPGVISENQFSISATIFCRRSHICCSNHKVCARPHV